MKEKNSELELDGNGYPQKTARKGTGRKLGQAKAAKLLAELEHYRACVADNEERLRAGKASDGTPLTSHAFSKNLKRYANAAGIEKIHIHQTRHTFARIVAEESGSIVETQEALGHKNIATTRVYVGRIAVKRDKFGPRITSRLKIHAADRKDSEGIVNIRS